MTLQAERGVGRKAAWFSVSVIVLMVLASGIFVPSCQQAEAPPRETAAPSVSPSLG